MLTVNAGTPRTYPFFPEVQITVGAAALADPNAWYYVYYWMALALPTMTQLKVLLMP